MTETELKAGFYNAVMVDGEPDRTYNAEEVNDYLKGIVSDNGIFANISTACQVTAGTGMQVIVKAGRGKVNNHWFEIESDVTLDIAAADVILNRIDTIVVRHDAQNRNVTLAVKTGTPASEPFYTLSRIDELYEICLATVMVEKNAKEITNARITDHRPITKECGWITGLINQVDTTTLYNQYQDAQEKFIAEKTTEFENWFSNVQDEVKATSLYREYQALYRTNASRQSVIPIPTSINYVHNSLDVLNVFINGMRLLKDVEYTINSSGTEITLASPLDVEKQDVEFVNKKAVDGAVAESIVLQVESLQKDVNNLAKCSYVATGTNDNINLSNMITNFLNATGDYSAVGDTASLRIEVVGLLATDNLMSDQMVFDFHASTSSNRKVIVDFGSATVPVLTRTSGQLETFAVFGLEDNVIIENATVKLNNYDANTIYGFHGGIARNCNLIIENPEIATLGSVYGAWGAKEVSNNEITITANTDNVYGTYVCDKVLYNNISTSRGYSIKARDKQILIGNTVNRDIDKTSGTVELGTVVA